MTAKPTGRSPGHVILNWSKNGSRIASCLKPASHLRGRQGQLIVNHRFSIVKNWRGFNTVASFVLRAYGCVVLFSIVSS